MSDDQKPSAKTASIDDNEMKPSSSSNDESDLERSEREQNIASAHKDEQERRDNDSDDRNYSITARWGQRMQVVGKWANATDAWADGILRQNDEANHEWLNTLLVGLNKLAPPSADELFMRIDRNTQFGRALLKFEADIEILKEECRTTKEYIESEEQEIRDCEEEVRSLEGSATPTDQQQQQLTQRVLKFCKDTIVKNRRNIERAKKSCRDLLEKVKVFTKEVWLVTRDILSMHESVKNKFSHVKSKGNETFTTPTSATMKKLDSDRFDSKALPGPSELDLLVPKPNQQFRNALKAEVTKQEKTELASLHAFVANIFKVSSQTNNERMVQNTVNDILNWELSNGDKVSDDKKKSYYARPPANKDMETTADQPILQAVICRIIRILADNNKDGTVLNKYEHLITSERNLAGSTEKNERERRIDIAANKSEEFLPLMLASMVQKPIEIKVGRFENGKFIKATEKGRSQITGHLGKRLEYYFHFGGVGLDASCVGIAINTLCIEVIGLELSNVGSTGVKLALVGTGLVPLHLVNARLPKGIKNLFVKEEEGGEGGEGEEEEAGEEVEGEEEVEEAEGEEAVEAEGEETANEEPESLISEGLVSDGFVLLAAALKRKVSEDFTSESPINQVRPTEEELVVSRYLGSGAFANVVQLGQDEFMKIPKTAAQAKTIRREADILVALSGNSVNIPQPQFVAEGGAIISTIRSLIRSEVSEVIGLRLKGVVGSTLRLVPRQIWQQHHRSIIENVYAALQFAHSKSIYHLDVRPSNIIVKVGERENEPPAVMLSDWGLAVQGRRAVKGFHGCTPYAHDRLLGEKSKGRLGVELDFASLAYTIDHVSYGRLRWMCQFDRPTNVRIEGLELRRKLVREWLEDPSKLPMVGAQQPLLPFAKNIQKSMQDACHFEEDRKSPRLKAGTATGDSKPETTKTTPNPTKKRKRLKSTK